MEKQCPEAGVGAIVVNSQGSIFLMKSPKWHDKYVIPGGHVELGERMIDALKREMKEETGLDVENCYFLCVEEAIFDDDFWKKKHFIGINFEATAKGSEVTLNDEGHDHIWVAPKDALKLDLTKFTRSAIEKFITKSQKTPE